METQVGQSGGMSDSYLIFTDCHGSMKTLLALIEKHGKGRQLISCGDEIDRGPDSRGVIEYMMANKVPSVASNHIDLCLAYSAHAKLGYRAKCSRDYDRDVWFRNGGNETLKSWGLHRGQALPKDVLDWMANLPPYVKIDVPNADGRTLLCSHSGYGLDADTGNWFRALWGRYPDDGEFVYEKGTGKAIDDGFLRVYGHTKNHTAQSGNGWVNIDTGCAYESYGVLTGFLYPECVLVTQSNLDT